MRNKKEENESLKYIHIEYRIRISIKSHKFITLFTMLNMILHLFKVMADPQMVIGFNPNCGIYKKIISAGKGDLSTFADNTKVSSFMTT